MAASSRKRFEDVMDVLTGASIGSKDRLRELVLALERAEITPEVFYDSYPIEGFIVFFRDSLAFEVCIMRAMKDFGIMPPIRKKGGLFGDMPEGLRLLVLRRAFEIFLRRLIKLVYGLRVADMSKVKIKNEWIMDKILETSKFVQKGDLEGACKHLIEATRRVTRRKKLIRAIIVLGAKAFILWNRRYGLSLPEGLEKEGSKPSEPELEYSESYEPCLAAEIPSSF